MLIRRSFVISVVVVIFVLLPKISKSLLCYCDDECPKGTSRCNGTVCYARLILHTDTNKHDWDYGCFSRQDVRLGLANNNSSGVCKGDVHPNPSDQTKFRYKCCDNKHFCNENINVTIPFNSSYATSSTILAIVPSNNSPGDAGISFTFIITVPIVAIGACAIIFNIIAIIIVACFKHKRKSRRVPSNGVLHHTNHNHHNHHNHPNSNFQNSKEMCLTQTSTYNFSNSIEPVPVTVSDISLTCTSGSGSGLPFLVKRTIARSIVLGDPIGGGRFGQVYVGKYQGEKYAVKKFFSKDEQSWFHESDMYNSVNLRHENILSCFATDMLSNNGVTELWLITQYYPRGSLFDELHREPFSALNTMKLILSACRGITYLHTELSGTQGKPSIAHRDIKSKNILVKNDDTCCIADFGLAIVKNSNRPTFNTPENLRQGTKRYMSPEILSESINICNFESFLRSDIYSFGLVMWEICRRCKDGGEAEDYEVPFHSLVPADPSFEDMKEIIVDKNAIPEIPNRWTNSDLLRGLSKIMCECWYRDPAARPTAFYIRKKLDKLAENCELKMCFS